jgi:leader peptidase (prepilin peptidase)/N-methyltransferase
LALLIVSAAVLGLVVGSFLNVVIYRVPRNQSLISPGSRCPNCESPIRARHNIPLLGWLVLRGRCAACGRRISIRYPLVELATAGLFVAVAYRMDALRLLAGLPAYWFFTALAVTLAAIDVDVRRLPNSIVLPSYPVLAILLTVASIDSQDWKALAHAGVGAAALFGFYLLLATLYPAGMGFGDVKLAGLLGGVLGYLSWSALLVGAFAGFFLGALVGILLMAGGRAGRKTALPFGPAMLAGALVALFFGREISDWYLNTLLV